MKLGSGGTWAIAQQVDVISLFGKAHGKSQLMGTLNENVHLPALLCQGSG